MIPREILKKIRQTKFPTSRIATETLPGFLFQSSAQLGGIPRAVEYSRDEDKIGRNAEKDAIFVECLNRGSANLTAPQWKSFGVFQDALDGGMHFGLKLVSQARLAIIVPSNGILKLKPSFRVEDYLAAHFRFLSLSGSSARICSHGMPLSGLRLNRSARRSASSICSGDKPSSKSPNSSKIWPATSRRSFSGKRRICSKISVALMCLIYRKRLELQADL
jgi:hypothetical protein